MDPQTNHPVVFLREKDGSRVLPIWIGQAEANAIAIELRGQETPRPMTHDLLKRVIIGLGATLQQVLITKVEQNTYFAELEIRRDGHIVQIDARPSDSIAVALRLRAPIFTNDELLAEAGEEGKQPSPEPMDSDALKRYLKDLDPEDFGKFKP